MTVVVAVAGGLLIGLLLGTLGAGGSVLAVPVMVLGLGLDGYQATTGSLVVVGVTAAVAALAARREGTVSLDRGLLFAGAAVAGAVAGAAASGLVSQQVLLLSFAGLLVVSSAAMLLGPRPTPGGDEPVVGIRPWFCNCPRAVQVAATASAVGLLTGFLGVGGGFLVVPALVLALGLDQRTAAGTSLVVIAITTVVALATRLLHGAAVPWTPVLLLTGSALVAAVIGTRIASRTPTAVLQKAFAVVLVAAAGTTAWQALAT